MTAPKDIDAEREHQQVLAGETRYPLVQPEVAEATGAFYVVPDEAEERA